MDTTFRTESSVGSRLGPENRKGCPGPGRDSIWAGFLRNGTSALGTIGREGLDGAAIEGHGSSSAGRGWRQDGDNRRPESRLTLVSSTKALDFVFCPVCRTSAAGLGPGPGVGPMPRAYIVDRWSAIG